MIKETLLLGSICCFATMSFAVARFGDVPAPTGMEWEQEQNLSLNKEPARAWAFSFTDVNVAKYLRVRGHLASRMSTLPSRFCPNLARVGVPSTPRPLGNLSGVKIPLRVLLDSRILITMFPVGKQLWSLPTGKPWAQTPHAKRVGAPHFTVTNPIPLHAIGRV